MSTSLTLHISQTQVTNTSFPSASIVFNIYGTATKPPDLNSYKAPGPAVWSGPSGGSPTTTGGGSAPTGATAPLYGQCGGRDWTGPTVCASGTCKVSSGKPHPLFLSDACY